MCSNVLRTKLSGLLQFWSHPRITLCTNIRAKVLRDCSKWRLNESKRCPLFYCCLCCSCWYKYDWHFVYQFIIQLTWCEECNSVNSFLLYSQAGAQRVGKGFFFRGRVGESSRNNAWQVRKGFGKSKARWIRKTKRCYTRLQLVCYTVADSLFTLI